MMNLDILTACLMKPAGSAGTSLAILGEKLDPIFPIILGVVLICLILLRSHFRKKD
jgi:hypothetical protein